MSRFAVVIACLALTIVVSAQGGRGSFAGSPSAMLSGPFRTLG